MELDLGGFGVDPSMITTLHTMMDSLVEEADATLDLERPHPPSRAYVRDTKAMRNTQADIIEYPSEYRFIVDMPGLSPEKVRVQLENGNTVVVSGERKREKEKHEREEGVKYLGMERKMGKMLKKFVLPDDSNTDGISAVYRDGELTVTVEKLPPPEPKKSRNIEVQVGGGTTSSIEHQSAGSEQQQQEGAQSGGVQTVQVT